jgi:hypothetical protein
VDRSKPGDLRALSGIGFEVDMGDGMAMDIPMRPRGAFEKGFDEAPFGASALEAADGVAARDDGSVVASVAMVAADAGGGTARVGGQVIWRDLGSGQMAAGSSGQWTKDRAKRERP